MIRLNEIDSIYVDEELAGLTKRFVEDGIVARQVDLLFIGFGFSVRNHIVPSERIRRHDLLRAGGVDPDTRLAVEAVAPWYAQAIGHSPITDARSLLDFTCRVGSAGLAELRKRWEGRSKSQIEYSILQLSHAEANVDG